MPIQQLTKFAAKIPIFAQTMRALGFLSRYPVSSDFFENCAENLNQTSAAFPLAGLVIAIPAAIFAWLSFLYDVNAFIAAIIIIAYHIIITGALHEDGLSDTFDGVWGGKTREKMLNIMRDSTLGTYGTLSLIVVILAKFASLTLIIEQGYGGVIIIAAAMLSRAEMVWHWHETPPIRQDGVASSAGQPDSKTLQFAIFYAAIISLPLLVFTIGILKTALLMAVVAIVMKWFTRLIQNKIGGHTGDTIGASQQLSETSIYLALALTL